MNGDDPIAAYLRRIARALGRWQPGRRRILAEIEDHLREQVDEGRTAEEAVSRFGDAESVAAGLSHPPRRAFAAVLGTALALAASAAWLADSGPSAAAPVTITPSREVVPSSVVAAATTDVHGHVGAPPTGVRVDAYAPLASGEVLAFSAYSARGHLCYLTYVAHPRRLTPFPRNGADWNAGEVDCRLSPTPAVDMLVSGGSGMQFILFGTAPRAATELAVTDVDGRTRTFALPQVGVRGAPSRQAVIVDLTTVGIHSCDRLALLAGGRVLAHEQFGAA